MSWETKLTNEDAIRERVAMVDHMRDMGFFDWSHLPPLVEPFDINGTKISVVPAGKSLQEKGVITSVGFIQCIGLAGNGYLAHLPPVVDDSTRWFSYAEEMLNIPSYVNKLHIVGKDKSRVLLLMKWISKNHPDIKTDFFIPKPHFDIVKDENDSVSVWEHGTINLLATV